MSRSTSAGEEAFADAIVHASRALVAIAARSLVDAEVTLPQYRALVVLQTRGPQSLAQLAEQLGVAPSTATRMCDRLVAKGMVSRAPAPESRREIELSVTAAGRKVVSGVTRRRRTEIDRALARMSERQRRDLAVAFRAFAEAADEAPDDDWYLGWT